jgi:hypothetical protein
MIFKNSGKYEMRRAAMASQICQAIANAKISASILRNAARILDEGLGDLDIWLMRSDLQLALAITEKCIKEAGWVKLKRVVCPYSASLYFCSGCEPGAANLTVDFFWAIRWYVGEVLSYKCIQETTIKGKYPLPEIAPFVSFLAATVHHLLWNKEIQRRYTQKAEESRNPTATYSSVIGYYSKILEIENAKASRVRRQMIVNAIIRSILTSPHIIIADIWRLFVLPFIAEEGLTIAIRGEGKTEFLGIVQQRFAKDHYLIGRWGAQNAPDGLQKILMNARRRLGAVQLYAAAVGQKEGIKVDIELQIDRLDHWQIAKGSSQRTGEGIEQAIEALKAAMCQVFSSRHLNP